MNRIRAVIPILILSGVVLSACDLTSAQSPPAIPASRGYGLIVGAVRPCSARYFDASSANPLVVVLTRDAKTYDVYNVSADRGTTWFHFDVPVGRYTLSTTYPGTKDYSVGVSFAKTTTLNVKVSCSPRVQ